MAAAGSHNDGTRFTLTQRQREVIELMVQGKTNFEIAQHLGISLEGAKYHVREILTKLRVDTREEAVAAWPQRHRPGTRATRVFTALHVTGWFKRIAVASTAAAVCTAVAVALVVTSGSPTTVSTTVPPGSTTSAGALDRAPAAPRSSTPPVPSKGPPVLWRWNTGDPHDMAWFGVGPSIVAVAVAPLSPGTGYVAALDPSTGYERWHYAVPSGAFPPALTSHAVIFGTVDGTVWALDESSADVLWTASFPGIPFQVIAADGAIVVADADPALWGADGLIDKTRLAGRVWGLDPVTGDKLWTIDTGTQQAFVAASGSTVVISTSGPRNGANTETMAVDSTTGERLWEKPTDSSASPPIISGTAVYVATSIGKLLALNLGTGEELWTVSSTDGTNYQIPAVVGNALLVPSTANTLDARDPSTGSLLWTNTIAGCPAHASGPSQVFQTGNQTFVLACGGLYTVGGAGQQPTPWIIPQGGFEWVTPIPHGVLGSSYTGEGPVGLMALGVD